MLPDSYTPIRIPTEGGNCAFCKERPAELLAGPVRITTLISYHEEYWDCCPICFESLERWNPRYLTRKLTEQEAMIYRVMNS